MSNDVCTRKKVKAVGTETYINQKTGELKEMQVISVEERDFNFHKVWLRHLLNCLDVLGSKKTKLAFWIIDNLNSDNVLVCSLRQICEKTGFSLETVRVTVKLLIESNFLVKVNAGAYMVNPNIIFRGGSGKRFGIYIEYSRTKEENEKKDLKKNMEKAPAEEILQEAMPK